MIRNGPKDIFVFSFAFLNNNNIEEKIPPIINALDIKISELKSPKAVASGITSLTSPRPIPLPFVRM